MKPAVYILCGIPFSGKTTLARILATQLGWAHVDIDAIVQSLVGPDERDVSEAQWAEAFSASYQQVAASLAHGQSVVHDATNYARAVRDRVRAIADQFGASAHVIYITVPVCEANQRRIANQTELQRHQVSDADFHEVLSNLEPPTADESVLIFDGTLDIATWIECFITE